MAAVVARAAPWTTLADFYELDKSIAAILRRGAKRVALQFPDACLPDTIAVKEQLQAGVGRGVRFFILGDTSYGSVHVDEVNAQHIGADLIIHYGAAHVSATHRTPVQWILNKAPCPRPAAVLDLLRAELLTLERVGRAGGGRGGDADGAGSPVASHSQLIVAFQSPFLHLRPAVQAAFAAQPRVCLGASVLDEFGFCSAVGEEGQAPVADSVVDGNPGADDAAVVCGSSFRPAQPTQDPLNIESNVLVYIGEQSDFGDSLFLRFSRCAHRQLDPTQAAPRVVAPQTDVNKVMMKRFYVIEALRRANSVGIVVGTLAIHRYTDVLHHVKSILEKSGKKPYVFVVGKINVAKLSNFGDIDAFVHIGGIDHALLGNKDFPKVIATPFEACCAFGGRTWTGEYIVDFDELLSGEEHRSQPARGASAPDRVHADGEALSTVGQRGAGTHLIALDSPAAVMLQQKEYRGLEIDRANNAVELATRGQFGIAREYSSEGSAAEAGGSPDADHTSAAAKLPRAHDPTASVAQRAAGRAVPEISASEPELEIAGNALFDDGDMSDVSSFDNDTD